MKTNEQLALEVQELRQFCIMMMVSVSLDQRTRDYWWEKLGGYEQLDTTGM